MGAVCGSTAGIYGAALDELSCRDGGYGVSCGRALYGDASNRLATGKAH